MFRNYFQVAIRNLINNPIPAVINISGLVIGMTAFILIIQYIRFELSYDNFHEKSDRIFRDVPVNSHLKPDILVSWETLVFFSGQDINTAWQWDGFFNYILLNPSSDYKEFEAKIPAFVKNEIGEDLERWNAGGIRLFSQGDDESNQYRIIGMDFDFVDFYGLFILEGRNFSRNFGRNTETVLFNENAVRFLGFEDFASAMNQQIYFWGDTFSIVGVVKNYHQEGLKVDQEPLVFWFFENITTFYSKRLPILIRRLPNGTNRMLEITSKTLSPASFPAEKLLLHFHGISCRL